MRAETADRAFWLISDAQFVRMPERRFGGRLGGHRRGSPVWMTLWNSRRRSSPLRNTRGIQATAGRATSRRVCSSESIMSRVAIRSGGQTGVDRAALDFAIARLIPWSGWCPRGGLAEDFLTPPGVLARYAQLSETPSSRPEQRTAWNVRDSDATLVLLIDRDLEKSPGTQFALVCAELVFLRPFYVASVSSTDSVREAGRWLSLAMARTTEASFTLNVAGPRESESPGIYALSSRCLELILGA
jgi:hypothetical protein